MIIGIIGAMEEEVTILRELMTDKKETTIASCHIYQGKINGQDVALLLSGVGKTAAAMGTTLLIQLVKPDLIINTGSAGGLLKDLNIGDIVVSTEVRYHDVDVTNFNYEIGQMVGCPPAFLSDSSLIELAITTAKQQNIPTYSGLICSGDIFANSEQTTNKIKSNFPDVIAVEMEAASIAHVCFQFKIPFVVVRAISDTASSNAHIDFDQFLTTASQNFSKFIVLMLAKLQASAH